MKLHKIVAVATLILLTFPMLSLQADAQKLKLTLVDGSAMEGDFTANATRFTSNNAKRTYYSGYQMNGNFLARNDGTIISRSFIDGEPEENSLARNFSDAYYFLDIMK